MSIIFRATLSIESCASVGHNLLKLTVKLSKTSVEFYKAVC